MKKLINKLFEWLGYVPKDIENRYKNLMWKLDQHDYYLLNNINEYCVIPYKGGFLVTEYCEKTGTHRMVKFFIDLYDEYYAKLCAEELCEMLNQKI